MGRPQQLSKRQLLGLRESIAGRFPHPGGKFNAPLTIIKIQPHCTASPAYSRCIHCTRTNQAQGSTRMSPSATARTTIPSKTALVSKSSHLEKSCCYSSVSSRVKSCPPACFCGLNPACRQQPKSRKCLAHTTPSCFALSSRSYEKKRKLCCPHFAQCRFCIVHVTVCM